MIGAEATGMAAITIATDRAQKATPGAQFRPPQTMTAT